MTLLAVVGAVGITAALIYFTWGFFGLLFLTLELNGWDKTTAKYTATVGFGWLLSVVTWWWLVGSNITIGFS